LEVSRFSQCFQESVPHFAAFPAIEINMEFLFVGMAIASPVRVLSTLPRKVTSRGRPTLTETSLAIAPAPYFPDPHRAATLVEGLYLRGRAELAWRAGQDNEVTQSSFILAVEDLPDRADRVDDR